jgi:hypothetical protein
MKIMNEAVAGMNGARLAVPGLDPVSYAELDRWGVRLSEEDKARLDEDLEKGYILAVEGREPDKPENGIMKYFAVAGSFGLGQKARIMPTFVSLDLARRGTDVTHRYVPAE